MLRLGRLAVLASCVVVAAGCTGSSSPASNNGQAPRADEALATLPSPEDVAIPTPLMPNPASAEIVRQERLYRQPDPLGSLQRQLGVAPVMLPPGEHTSDALGIEVTLQLDDWWRLDVEEAGSFTLNRPDAPVKSLLPAMVFMRPVGLAPVTRVADGDLLRGEQSVSPDDLGAWLDQVPQIEVLDRGTFTVGDRDGTWFDVDVHDDAGPVLDGCVPGVCVHTWWSGGTRSTVARDQEMLRYYSFPDPQGPIYVLVAAADEEFDDWNLRTASLLESATFGPSAPHPVEPGVSYGLERAHDAGVPWRFIQFPGVVVTAQRFSVSFQVPGHLQFQPFRSDEHSAPSSLVRPVASYDGEPLADVSAVIDLLEGSGLDRVGQATLLDQTVPIYSGQLSQPILRHAELREGDDPVFVRFPQFEHVQIWVFDGPDGPLLVAAEGETAGWFDDAIGNAELLIDSLEFE